MFDASGASPSLSVGREEGAMPSRTPSILVVDDDLRILKLLKRDLQLEGYRATVATGGRMALQLIENEEPDLVLLDIMMPGMDG
jgi:CheY-like chemotaxis protein